MYLLSISFLKPALFLLALLLLQAPAQAQTQDNSDAFITTWNIQFDYDIVTIGNRPETAGSYTVDWGDGESTSYSCTANQSCNAAHQYINAGVYHVVIQGDGFQNIRLHGADASRLVTLEQWGDIRWTTMENAFRDASNLRHYTATDAPDLSRVTSMASMFRGASAFNGDLSAWDVSNVTNMIGLFASALRFNADLSEWDVSNVVNMAGMFDSALAFNSDLSRWDVSKVTDMQFMFSNARMFESDLSEWDVSSVTNMDFMFYSTLMFNSDLSLWDVSNVESMEQMFNSAQAFNRDISGWDVSKVTNMSSMFDSASAFDQNLGAWYIRLSSLTIFEGASIAIGAISALNAPLRDQNPRYAIAAATDDDSDLFEVTDDNILGFKATAPQRDFDSTPSYMATIEAQGRLFGRLPASAEVVVQIQPLPLAEVSVAAGIAGDDAVNIVERRTGFAITGTATAGSTVTVTVSAEMQPPVTLQSVSASEAGAWQVNVPADAAYLVQPQVAVRASAERVGNRPGVSNTRTLVVDVTAPTLSYAPPLALTVGVELMPSLTPSGELGDVPMTGAYAVVGDEPLLAGLALDRNSGVISGTPAVSTEDKTVVTIEVADRVGNSTQAEVVFPMIDKGEQTISGFAYSATQVNVVEVTPTVTAPSVSVPVGAAGAVTYALSSATDPNICTVDEMTGALSLTAVVGVCEITATVAETPNYFAASATARVTVIDNEDAAFITAWRLEAGDRIAFNNTPLTAGKYRVDWGDGSREIYECVADVLCGATHTYTVADSYRVAIKGPGFQNIRIDSESLEKLRAIEQWGDVRWTTMENAFLGASNLNRYTATDAPDLSRVTSMASMFRGASQFNGDLSAWDVSNVTNMVGLFASALRFNANLSEWNVSNVTSMAGMFDSALAFNSDLSRWDVSNVTEMQFMFSNARIFESDLSGWDVSNVINMDFMFHSTLMFNSDLSRWDVSNVESMEQMFGSAQAFNRDISGWDVSKVKNMSSMFDGADAFDQNLGAWYIRLNRLTVLEGASTAIGAISALNAPLRDQNPRYAIAAATDDDSDLFEVTGDNILRFKATAPQRDFDSTPSYTVTIEAQGRLFGTLPASTEVVVQVQPLLRAEVSVDTGIADDDAVNIAERRTGFAITGTATEGSTVTVTIGGSELLTTVLETVATNWQINVPANAEYLIEPEVVVTATATRARYIDSTESTRRLVVDVTAPTLSYAPPLALTVGVELIPSLTPSGELSDLPLSGAYAVVGDEPLPQGLALDRNNGVISGIPALSIEEKTVVTIEVADRVGNSAQAEVVFPMIDKGEQTISDFAYSATQVTTLDAEPTLTTPKVTAALSGATTGMLTYASDNPVACAVDETTGALSLAAVVGVCEITATVAETPNYFAASATARVTVIDNEDAAFITAWLLEAGDRIAFNNTPLTAGKYRVDWGDGSREIYECVADVLCRATHTYRVADSYRVTIKGPGFQNMRLESPAKLTAIEQWGDVRWTTMENAFRGASNLNRYTATDAPDLSRVTSMASMFRGASQFNGDLSAWDVSNVTSMFGLFAGAFRFNANLSEWNVSSVTNTQFMFSNARRFESDLGRWDVSNVVNMAGMFDSALAFNSDLSRWDVSKVTDMQFMFFSTSAFNSDISGWDVSSVVNMDFMFHSTLMFNSDLNRWDVSNVESMEQMFHSAQAFNRDISGWDVSKVTNMSSMFDSADAFDQNLGAWYIRLNRLTVFEGASTAIGMISALNAPLRDQNPRYAIAAATDDDSDLFEVTDDNILRFKATAPQRDFDSTPSYTVTIEAQGSLFGRLPASTEVVVQIQPLPPAEVSVAVGIAGDDTVNIAERRAGFAITGTASAGSTVTVTVSAETLPPVLASEAGAWQVNVPAEAAYLVQPQVAVRASAERVGNRPGVSSTRTLVVDVTAPTLVYETPSTITVGIAIAPIAPSGELGDVPLTGAYAVVGEEPLPQGLALDRNSGVISGTPVVSTETRTVMIAVTDIAGNSTVFPVVFAAIAKGEQTISGFAYSAERVSALGPVPTLVTPTVTAALSGATTGVLTYALSSATDLGVCDVNSRSGELMLGGAAGECEVIANVAATDDYNAASAMAVVSVRERTDLIVSFSPATTLMLTNRAPSLPVSLIVNRELLDDEQVTFNLRSSVVGTAAATLRVAPTTLTLTLSEPSMEATVTLDNWDSLSEGFEAQIVIENIEALSTAGLPVTATAGDPLPVLFNLRSDVRLRIRVFLEGALR